ncbi:hypothetical protein QTP86_013454 [Hemibagrus guttatus]|nr:hypothetical protein QTP86_013454 [Hemibagrus guttatus]
MAASTVFQRLRTGSKIGAQYDQEGNIIQVETREDEEQSVKLAEILELLLAAGYFRARIKGLSPFDKVVGGMTWCITTCNFDIDVDLLFQENSTIGQKMMDMAVVNTYFQKREEHRVALRILMEKYRDGQRELHCVFVDLEKAYDRVPREELWYCMRKSGVAEKYVRLVQDMYERSRTVVRCAVGQTEEFKVEVGLHQGSALSPFLFAMVMDQLSEEVRQESPWTMMFADDIVICSESREQVEENLERWRFVLERRGMKVSRSKTEYMCVNEREGSGTVRLQGEEVKKVQEFKYLGSTVQSNGECGKEWLVKRAIETREEMGDHVRAYSVSQFQKTHSFPEDEEFEQRKQKAVRTVVDVSRVYAPQRRYKRQADAGELLDEESRVHSTLLEYGRRYGFSKHSKQDKAEEKKLLLGQGGQNLPAGMTEVSEEEDLQAAEELRIKALMTGMAAMATEEGRLTANTVGQIVGLQSEEIKQIAFEYAEKTGRSAEDRTERYGPVQQHRRMVTSFNKQLQQKTKDLEEMQAKQQNMKTACEEAKSKLTEATELAEQLEKELGSLADVEAQADTGLLEKLRALVAMNENLKQQEQEFRTHCREEMTRLQQSIEDLKMEFGDEADDQKERSRLIDQQYRTDREKLQKIRLLMARRNREIAILQRKIDEVPSRAELTQYQKRFIELYSQVSATHKETKQFFTLYNTLDDKKVYLEKEVNLLNSIHDNFQQAMASSGAKEQFLRQMEQIVEGIKQSRIKMEKKKQENKMRRDQLNDEYLELLDKQRLYFKTVKDFKEECRKNEMLLSKLRAKGAS